MDISFLLNILRATTLFCVIAYVFNNYRKNRSIAVKLDKLPGPKCIPILGNLIQIGVFNSALKKINLQTILLQHRRGLCQLFSKEKIFRLWFGPYPFVFFFRPESVKVLLKSNVLIDKSSTYNFLETYLGKSLFLNTGDAWREQRHAMTPAFHFNFVKDFIPIVNSECDIFIDTLRKLCEKDWFDIVPVLTMCTLDIFAKSSFGISLKSKEDHKRKYSEHVRRVLENAGIRGNFPWYSPNYIFDNLRRGKVHKETVVLLRELAATVVEERRKILAEKKSEAPTETDDAPDENVYFMGNKQRLGSLDILLKRVDEGKITEKVMQDEMNSLLLAGHDTTKSSLAMTLYLIGLYPEVQDEIVDELRTVFGNDKQQHVSFDDISKLKYTECVIKESLRLYPTVPLIGRSLTEDINIDGYTVPKGTQCTLLLQEVHRDPEEFPNPEVFDPDRFLPENCTKRHPYSYIPFSAGARNCIGQRFALLEERIIVASILRNFKIRSLDPLDKIHVVSETVLSVASPVRMKFTER